MNPEPLRIVHITATHILTPGFRPFPRLRGEIMPVIGGNAP